MAIRRRARCSSERAPEPADAVQISRNICRRNARADSSRPHARAARDWITALSRSTAAEPRPPPEVLVCASCMKAPRHEPPMPRATPEKPHAIEGEHRNVVERTALAPVRDGVAPRGVFLRHEQIADFV